MTTDFMKLGFDMIETSTSSRNLSFIIKDSLKSSKQFLTSLCFNEGDLYIRQILKEQLSSSNRDLILIENLIECMKIIIEDENYNDENSVEFLKTAVQILDSCSGKACLNILSCICKFASRNSSECVKILSFFSFDKILNFLESSEDALNMIAAKIIVSLSSQKRFQNQLKDCKGIPRILMVFKVTSSLRLKWLILKSMLQFCQDYSLLLSFVDEHGIDILISHIKSKTTDYDIANSIQENTIFSGILSLLSIIAGNDFFNFMIYEACSLNIISTLLKAYFKRSLDIHEEYENSSENIALCCLRLLCIHYSNLQCRKIIHKILPTKIMDKFIEIGNDQHSLLHYASILDDLKILNTSEKEKMFFKLDKVNDIPSRYVGNIQIIRILGEGAFGSVFKARKDSGQIIALKEIENRHFWFKSNNFAKQDTENIINEVEIMKQKLNHPNIVHYYSAFILDRKLYITMQYIDGISLNQYLNSFQSRHLFVKEKEVMKIISQLLSALHYLHKKKNVVHRDLSSNNVIISRHIKITLTDFGLSHHQKTNDELMNSTVGTILYNCPEVVKNEQYTEKSDIWALGCLIYEVCSLKHPFIAENILSIARKIVEGKYDLSCCYSYGQRICSLISGCLTVNHYNRPDVIQASRLVVEDLLDLIVRN